MCSVQHRTLSKNKAYEKLINNQRQLIQNHSRFKPSVKEYWYLPRTSKNQGMLNICQKSDGYFSLSTGFMLSGHQF
jgi:hypothetical protein